MNPLIQLKTTPPLLITLALLCIGLLPRAQAVSPPPPGGYPNFTTAAGDHALQALTLGLGNTALGTFSLFSVTTGNFNTAVGAGALDLNTADSNTATGTAALLFNTTGTENTANGTAALEFNETGSDNTATGAFALFSNNEGNDNTAIGADALINNTGVGNIALGAAAGFSHTTGDNNIYIGASGVATEGGTIRIGDATFQTATFIAGISGATVTGTAVVVNGSGQLGVAPSSARFKEAIKSMDNASETLFSLKPVTFRYKKDIDPKSTAQFGLVAEDVEKVNADLVVRDAGGKVYTVRYDAVNAMLLNEFLKEHRKVQELETGIATLTTQLKEQAAQIQKVSSQLELSKPAPQVVNNP
jgi:trimeric autotransporter adhesin